MPLIPLQTDNVGEALQFVNAAAAEIGRFLSDALTRVTDRVSPMNPEFFGDARVGTSGVLLLTKLSAHITFLATHYPERMNATLARAGQYLTPHEDGTVTYDPPPPPPPPPPPVLGCTDPGATNYDPLATQDDGSCIYPQ